MSGADERHDPRARDQAARRLARREFDRPVVLEAGAGTGKTTTLVARVVTWLVDPGWERARSRDVAAADLDGVATRVLAGIVAITFTESAAADMDHKIRAGLALVEAGGAPVGMDVDEFRVDAATRRARSAALRRALERPIAQTIHSFCGALLKRHALEAGLRPGFEIDADLRLARDHVRAAVAEALSRARGDDRLADWIVLANRGLGPQAVVEALGMLVGQGVRPHQLERETFPPGALRALETRLRDAITVFLREVGPLLVGLPTRASKYAPLLVAGLRTVEGKLGEPSDDAGEVTQRTHEFEDDLGEGPRDRLARYAKGTFGTLEGGALGDDTRRVHACALALDDVWSRHVALDPELERAARRILHGALVDVRERLVRAGVQTFGDLLRDAADLLERDAHVRRRLRAEYETILVDEFQDTDPIQCRIVEALALGDERGPKPNLLVVGDPKQSIYGFRSADLAEYDRFTRKLREAGGEQESLTLNFRSLPHVLSYVNTTIARVMTKEIGLQPAFQALDAHRDRGEARIEVWNTWTYEGDAGDALAGAVGATIRVEAARLARELRRSRARGRAWKEMAVLVRKTTSIDVYLDALRDAGIPFEVAGDRSYYRRREVVDLAAVLAVVADPLDNVALVAFLRSPYVGVPDAWLAPLWTAGFPDAVAHLDARDAGSLARVRGSVRAALASAPRDVPGLAELEHLEASFDHALESLAHLRAVFAREPIDVFLEQLRTLFLVEATASARYQGRFRLANVARFLAQVESDMERTGGDAEALLRFLRTSLADAAETPEARPRETASDAVSVMTIHKSKGLDFHEVFVVGLSSGAGGRGGREIVTEFAGDEHVLLGAPSPGWHDVLVKRQKREQAESIRLLYVALTRAKDRLVISASMPLPSANGDGRRKAQGLWAHVALPEAARAYFDDWKRNGRPPALVLDGIHYVVACADEHEPVPEHVPEPGADPVPDRESALVSLARIRSDAETLARHRAQAARRAQASARVRMSGAPADERARGPWRDENASGDDATQADALGDTHGDRHGEEVATRAGARLVGTLVHEALARFPGFASGNPAAASTRSWHAALETLRGELLADARAALARAPFEPGPRPAAESLARAAEKLLTSLADGPGGEHARRVAPHVLAREFPLLATRPAAEVPDATALATGSVDLLWRDPADGRLVVVDYKTDDVHDDASIATRAAHHRAQLDAYRHALTRALELPEPPRGELWFLAASRVVRLDEAPLAP